MTSTIAGIKIPDSALARATTEYIRDIESDLLYHHSRRVFLFGALSGERQQLAYNPELLYVGAMFHDLGLVAGHRSDDQRFEVDGANAAAAFARAERYLGATPETRQGLAAAIALQTGRAQADLPWSRTAFFWHYAFPCSVRAATALVGWSLFWLGVFCQLLRRRGAGRAFLRSLAETCLLAGGLITAVFAASTLMTLTHERHDEATWGARVFAASASETEAEP